jgi:bisphosphoglycerate-dependent phosphoglycerate mutase
MNVQSGKQTNVIVVRSSEPLFNNFPNFDEEKKDRLKLTQMDRFKVRKLGDGLALHGWKPDLTITSSFTRARETACIINQCFGLRLCDILITDSLVELNKTEEAIFLNSREEGLSLANVRISKWFRNFIKNPVYAGKLIILITHGYAIESMIKCAENNTFPDRIEREPLTATRFQYKQGVIGVGVGLIDGTAA